MAYFAAIQDKATDDDDNTGAIVGVVYMWSYTLNSAHHIAVVLLYQKEERKE